MLMMGSISRICYNDNLKYKKILFGFAAGKFALDDSHFPSEHSLSDNEYMQAHANWILLLKATSDVEIHDGWKVHHDRMTGDPNLNKWALAWCLHNHQLHAQFAN